MIQNYFARFVLQSNPSPLCVGTKDGKTPILDELDLGGINTAELVDFVRKYGSLIEWCVDCESIDKQRLPSYTSLTKEQASYEMKSCLVDVLRKIIAEDNQRISNSKK